MKNEVMDNMEYLMQELHREWARSGPSRISCTLQSTEVSEVQGALAKQVEKQQLLLEREELTFQKSVQLLRMNYILLRLAKKMKAEQAQKSKDNDSGDLGLLLDEEEEQALSELMRNGKKEEKIEYHVSDESAI